MATLLELPVAVRNEIYRQVLVLKHSLFLFKEGSSQVEAFAPDKPPHWLALLSTCRQVSQEAVRILYGLNHFTLVEASVNQSNLLGAFFGGIGRANASFLQRLTINFPAVEQVSEGSERLQLTEEGLKSLALLHDHCSGLKDVEMHVYASSMSSTSPGMAVMQQSNAEVSREVFNQVSEHLQSMSSLAMIRVKIHGGTPSSTFLELAESHGWRVSHGS